MRRTTKLREMMKQGKTIVIPGCYNAVSGKILDKIGFPAIYMTGYGTSLSLTGMPDCGLATMTEMHLNARYISNAVSVPVIADADNGYGNAINVIRTVKEYIQTGVAAIHIEDQIIPKRCGHVAGRQVIPLEEAAGKYAAADYARKEIDEDFVIIARTDARGAVGGGLDDAINRANAYLKAGADVAFVEGPKDINEVKRICAEVDGPIMYNQTGISPRFSEEEMNELGIAMTILPGATMRMQLMAVYDLAMEMKQRGPLVEQEFSQKFNQHPLGDFHGFAGFDQVMEWEERFMGEAELAKYEGTLGHQPKAAE